MIYKEVIGEEELTQYIRLYHCHRTCRKWVWRASRDLALPSYELASQDS